MLLHSINCSADVQQSCFKNVQARVRCRWEWQCIIWFVSKEKELSPFGNSLALFWFSNSVPCFLSWEYKVSICRYLEIIGYWFCWFPPTCYISKFINLGYLNFERSPYFVFSHPCAPWLPCNSSWRSNSSWQLLLQKFNLQESFEIAWE